MDKNSQLNARRPVNSPSRKILCTSALVAAMLTATAPADAARPSPADQPQPELIRAGLKQEGQSLILSLRTAQAVALGKLEADPDYESAHSRYLCLAFHRPGGRNERRVCLGGDNPKREAGLVRVGGSGKVLGAETLPAEVKRPAATKLVLTFIPADAGLTPRRYHWRVLRSRGGCHAAGAKAPCQEALPTKGSRSYRLRPVRPVGCTGGTAGVDTNGSRGRKVVALTFDDGPSEYTPGFLQVLREKGVHGTFFEIGQEMPGREATMRQILAEGSEIGDHTMNHVEYPDYSQIAGAGSRIESYTHFKPCLFRPPGGAIDSSVISTAGGLGMRTITWDVDPTDWANPGSGAVYSRIVDAAQPGSIILMHDGGGDRSGTLAALPSIIDTLRARGYRFETVTQLLGYELLYRPFG
ncbi:MAG TPA: polysaccharide deacetylase family protein [Solirubrobacterales bacterium]